MSVIIIFHFKEFYYIYFAPTTAAFDFIVAVQWGRLCTVNSVIEDWKNRENSDFY